MKTQATILAYTASILMCLLFNFKSTVIQAQKNVMLIISDDIGVDATNGYHELNLNLSTPTLDSLRAEGLTFENAFATPVCGSTRATIMTGKHGIKTGMTGNGVLSTEHRSLFKAIADETDDLYSNAVIGKWHLAGMNNLNHPHDHGVHYYTGLIQGAPTDYFEWPRVVDGVSQTENNYLTESLMNLSIEWLNEQNDPWFLWLAHSAAHSPFHEPPAYMYSLQNTGNDYRKYLAMQEAMDYSIGRILANLSPEQKDSTVIIYIGDNGTPNGVLRDYPDNHGKGTVYQGGIRVPMIISGAGVTRKGEREEALVHVTDLHATILEIVGAELPGGIFNSLSFKNLLSGKDQDTRTYNYSEYEPNMGYRYCIRDEQYKLIVQADGTQEFYDLLNDSLEFVDLMDPLVLTGEQSAIKEDLEIEALTIQNDWSCRDFIQNGNEEGIDCGGSHCAPCVVSTVERIDESVKVYPNPTDDLLILESIQEIKSVQIISVDGRLLKSFDRINEKVLTLHLEESQNLVILKINLKDGKRIQKIISTL